MFTRFDVSRVLLQQIELEIEGLKASTQEAHRAATHEESRAEDKHDTRGLEASYLAQAQAKRVLELEKKLGGIRAFLSSKLFLELTTDHVAPGNLIHLETSGKSQWVFVMPMQLGQNVLVEHVSVQVISPESPLGEELIGRKVNDVFEVESRGGTRRYLISGIF